MQHHCKPLYWGIRSHIADYELEDALDCLPEKTEKLADVPTRLKRLSPTVQKQLINWGFAVCDAAMRKHVNSSLAVPRAFPYADAGVG
jgi:NTE family protein